MAKKGLVELVRILAGEYALVRAGGETLSGEISYNDIGIILFEPPQSGQFHGRRHYIPFDQIASISVKDK